MAVGTRGRRSRTAWGISRQAAQIAVERHYSRQRDTPEATRRSLTEGLDIVTANLFERLAAAKQDDNTLTMLAVAREIRSVTEQHARLDGLHAAQKVDVNVTQLTTVQVLSEFERKLLDAIDAEVVPDSIAAKPQPKTLGG